MTKLMDLAATQQGSNTCQINKTQERPKKLTQRRLPRFEVSSSYANYGTEDALYCKKSAHDADRTPKIAQNASSQIDTTDTSKTVQSSKQQNAKAIEEQIDAVLTLMASQNCLREILYKLLEYCEGAEHTCTDVENFLSQQPEIIYGHLLQPSYQLIKMMIEEGGLEERAYDSNNSLLSKEQLSSMDADAAADAVEYATLLTTEAGKAAIRLTSPEKRMDILLEQRPHRRETFLKLLEFCLEKPRKFPEIKQWYQETPGLAVDVVQKQHTLAADFYVDKLEKAGALVWKGAWCTTEAGKSLLLRERAS